MVRNHSCSIHRRILCRRAPFPRLAFRQRVLDDTTTPICISGAEPRQSLAVQYVNESLMQRPCRPAQHYAGPCCRASNRVSTDRHGLKHDNRGRHDAREAGTVFALRTRSRTGRREKKSGAAPERHVGVVVSSRTRSRNGG
jgi:hypothetical protein